MKRLSPPQAVLQTALQAISGRFSDPAFFLTSIVFLALAIRLLVVAFLVGQVSASRINYNDFGWESWEMGWVARSIALGRGFTSPFSPITGPTAIVPPLYPYLLAGAFKFLGVNTLEVAGAVLGFNSLCSALTCLPLYFLALRALNVRLARTVALAWAVYPFAVYFSADRVWDYALTGLLFACCLLAAQRLPQGRTMHWLGFGLLYGLTVLSNPSILSLLPIFLLLALRDVRRHGGRTIAKGLIAGFTFLAVCLPWTLRNERVMHSTFFIRDGFWLEFYAGNNGDTSESNASWAHPASNPAEMRMYQTLGETAYMQQKHDLSVLFVKRHPFLFGELCARRAIRFWTGYWSFRPGYLRYEPFDLPNVPFCLFLLYFTVRGLRRWHRQDKAGVRPYLLAVLVFPIPYYLTHSSMDYRQPLEPVLVLLVTVGLFGAGMTRPGRRHAAAKHAESTSVLV